MAPLPLDALDLAPERQALFRRWGLATLGDLAALPADGLASRLGPRRPASCAWRAATTTCRWWPTPLAESFACTLELDWPVDGLEPLAFLLAARAGAAVRHPGLSLPPGGGAAARPAPRGRAPPLPHAAPGRAFGRGADVAHAAAARPGGTLRRGEAIQAITVEAEPTLARAVQFSLLDPAQPSPEKLAEMMARLHEWTAEGRGGAATLLDSHRPGAFVMGSFAPPAFRPGAASAAPTRLALRVFRPPLPAQVSLKDGAPAYVSASGRLRPGGALRGPLAGVRRLVGRGLEPRGMGRGGRGPRPVPRVPRPLARGLVRRRRARLSEGLSAPQVPLWM